MHELGESVSSGAYYQIIMLLASLDSLKVQVLLTLSHIYPRTVSGSELTTLLGYSSKARTIYRGVLDALEEERYIRVERQSKKQFSICANAQHPVIQELIELSINHGNAYANNLIKMLQGRNLQ